MFLSFTMPLRLGPRSVRARSQVVGGTRGCAVAVEAPKDCARGVVAAASPLPNGLGTPQFKTETVEGGSAKS